MTDQDRPGFCNLVLYNTQQSGTPRASDQKSPTVSVRDTALRTRYLVTTMPHRVLIHDNRRELDKSAAKITNFIRLRELRHYPSAGSVLRTQPAARVLYRFPTKVYFRRKASSFPRSAVNNAGIKRETFCPQRQQGFVCNALEWCRLKFCIPNPRVYSISNIQVYGTSEYIKIYIKLIRVTLSIQWKQARILPDGSWNLL